MYKDDTASMNYAQAWSFVYFLCEHDNRALPSPSAADPAHVLLGRRELAVRADADSVARAHARLATRVGEHHREEAALRRLAR